jgi:hypothetical protein
MTTRRNVSRLALVIIMVSVAATATARADDRHVPDVDTVIRLTPAELTWTEGPAMLPPGARLALIEGAPWKPGPFTFRLKFPANYRIPPHWHPVKVTVTVLSGTFNMGFGDELDTGNGKRLPAGSVFEMPAMIHHFGWTTEETIIQEHGIGPLAVNYLTKADGRRH